MASGAPPAKSSSTPPPPSSAKTQFTASFSVTGTRVLLWVIEIVIVAAAGLGIFQELTFLSILDRALLFTIFALLTFVVIFVLMFLGKAREVDDVKNRLSAVSLERDDFERTAIRVPGLITQVAELEEKLTQKSKQLDRAVADAALLAAEKAKLIERAEAAETKAASFQGENEKLKAQLVEANKQLSTLEAERTALAGRAAGLESEKRALQDAKVRVDQQAEHLQQDLLARERALQQADRDLTREQTSNQRAQFTPNIELECGTLGFGILAAKRVYADIRNLGPGVAIDVNFSIADASAPLSARYTPSGYWTAVPAGDTRRVVIGDTNSLPNSIRCRVTFSSQFGPCTPAELIYTPG